MGLTQNLGRLSPSIFSDASLNIGVGAAPSGSYKFEVTGTSKVSGVLTLGSTLSNGTYTYTLPAATGTLALVGGAGVGTVTSVAALTIGTTGTDLSSTVATSTTTPVITLNVPTASAANRGALSSADWTTFNSKQGTITLTTTGTSGAATFTSNTLNIPDYGSALSGYLPLTGGTLTGALGGTSATFSTSLALTKNSNSGTAISITNTDAGSSAIAEYTLTTDSSGFAAFGKNSSTRDGAGIIDPSDTFIYSEKGNISIFNNFSSGAIRFAAGASSTAQFTIASSGAATFSSSVTAGGNIAAVATGTANAFLTASGSTGSYSGIVSLQRGGTEDGVLYTASTNYSPVTGASAADIVLYAAGGGRSLRFATSSSSVALTIASTGAATFSSSVFTLRSNIGTGTSDDADISLNVSAPSGSGKYIMFGRNGSNTAVFSISSAGVLGATQLNATTTAAGYAAIFTNTNGASDSNGLLVKAGSTSSEYNVRFANQTDTSTFFTVKGNGNVGIGTSSPNTKLDIFGGAGAGSVGMMLDGSGTPSLQLYSLTNEAGIGTNSYTSKPLTFKVNMTYGVVNSGTEAMRITSGGFFKASNTGSYGSTTSSSNEFNSNQADWTLVLRNTHSSVPYGHYVEYVGASPNSTGSEFLYCRDSSAIRTTIRSNGGLANFQTNNVNLSDERTKKDIIPLESYWDKFKAIEIVKFKYKDQTHDDFNIGVIAQQVEKVAPEFIDVDGWGETPEDGIPLKSVYTADLHHATIKVLQECMIKIEEQQAQIEELKQTVATK